MKQPPRTSLHLRLPATSANLGPGFDAVGLAMSLLLDIEASAAAEFRIEATGRDAALVGGLDGNLLLTTYRELMPAPIPLHLQIENGIPLGMGCGSSAAALLAGVCLANHFGGLGMTPEEVLDEACRREGHPDNVAACCFGGFTSSAVQHGRVLRATLGAGNPWRLLLVLPGSALPTSEARALLPTHYTRADAVQNVQAACLLVSAFALGRPELLRAATEDRLHQPYRSGVCPLLPALLPLAGRDDVYSVTLSGAGPAVLLIADPERPLQPLLQAVREAAGDATLEVLEASIAEGMQLSGHA